MLYLPQGVAMGCGGAVELVSVILPTEPARWLHQVWTPPQAFLSILHPLRFPVSLEVTFLVDILGLFWLTIAA